MSEAVWLVPTNDPDGAVADAFSDEGRARAQLMPEDADVVKKYVPAPAYPGHGHPWADFLHHRMRALVWLRDENKETPEATARTMSMDPGQVRMILSHADAVRSGEEKL